MQATHLNDDQFAAALEGSATGDVAAHLDQCAGCRDELGRTSVALGHMAAWSRAVAGEPAGFWYTQRQAIAGQIAGRREPSRLPAWAVVMAGLVMAAVMLAQGSAPDVATLRARAAQESGAEQANFDPDHALMLEIQAALRMPVPRPLEPALLVAQELLRAAEEAEAQP